MRGNEAAAVVAAAVPPERRGNGAGTSWNYFAERRFLSPTCRATRRGVPATLIPANWLLSAIFSRITTPTKGRFNGAATPLRLDREASDRWLRSLMIADFWDSLIGLGRFHSYRVINEEVE